MDATPNSDFAWPLLVAEIMGLCQQGIVPTKMRPDILEKIFADVDKRSMEDLRLSLMQIAPPRSPIQFEMQVAAPLWRLAATSPMAAMECGGAMPCCVRVSLPVAYPLKPLLRGHGGNIDVFSPGALGKPAGKMLTNEALAKMADIQKATPSGGLAEYLLTLVDWLQGTELHDFAASAYTPDLKNKSELGLVRAFVRFHHVLSIMKQCYLQIWANDLDVAVLLAAGQPAMLLVEGPRCSVQAYLDRSTKVMHWGPTPARLVGSWPVVASKACLRGFAEVSAKYPSVVKLRGTYNGRDCVDFAGLASCLERDGYEDAASNLRSLLDTAFAHTSGRVKESANGSGWVGYALREPELVQAPPYEEKNNMGDADSRSAPPFTTILADDAILVDGDEDSDDADLAEAIRLSLCQSAESSGASENTKQTFY